MAVLGAGVAQERIKAQRRQEQEAQQQFASHDPILGEVEP
jgi:hypothetical protein